MRRAIINPKKCGNCADCGIQRNCLQKAIIREETSSMPWVDFYKCSGCMQCKAFCSSGSVEHRA